MSKKKVEIKKNALEPQTIKVIKKHNFGFFFVLFTMGAFIATIYFLPELFTLYDNAVKNGTISFGKNTTVKNTTNNTVNNTTNTVVNNTVEEPVKEIEYLTLNTDDKVSFSDVSFDNISYNSTAITLNINSKTNSTLALNKKSYFMHIYDNNKTLLKTVYFADYVLGSSSKTININNAYYFNIESLTDKDYGFFVLEPDEYDQTFLTCTKNRTTIKYIFSDEKLVSIEDTITITNPTENDRAQYSGLKTTYEQTSGVTVKITDDDPYLFVINVDLRLYNGTLKTYYFSKDSDVRELKFKLEALDFTCR